MADNLFPLGYDEEIIREDELTSETPIGYRNGIAFDYETGDFMRDGMNKLLDSDGVESWISWCINCLQTERYKHLAYSTDFGIELDAAMASSSREEAESILTRQITEAILADPYERAAFISDIEYDWTAMDAVSVKVTIHGIDDVTIDLTAYLTRNPGSSNQPSSGGGDTTVHVLTVSHEGILLYSGSLPVVDEEGTLIYTPTPSVTSDGALAIS